MSAYDGQQQVSVMSAYMKQVAFCACGQGALMAERGKLSEPSETNILE